jgi:hypothetical protein
LTLPNSPPEAFSFVESRRKEVFSFEKVLVSAGNDVKGYITESKEVSEWFWVGSSVSEVIDFMEYVSIGTWT